MAKRSITKDSQPTQFDWPEKRAKKCLYCHSELVGECNCDLFTDDDPEFKVALTNVPPGSEEFLNTKLSAFHIWKWNGFRIITADEAEALATEGRLRKTRYWSGHRIKQYPAHRVEPTSMLICKSTTNLTQENDLGSKTAFGQICLLIEGFRDGLMFATSKKEG